MDIWTKPLIFVVIIICFIGFAGVRKMNKTSAALKGQKQSIPEAIEDHPFTLNPIVWVIFVASFFIGIVIFYYATSFY